MKKLSLLFVLFLCLTGAFGQRFVQYSEDSTRITKKMYFRQIK